MSRVENQDEMGKIISEKERRSIMLGDLFTGTRNRQDLISWRSLGVHLSDVLCSENPEWLSPPPETYPEGVKLIEKIIAGTSLAPLRNEVLWQVYGNDQNIDLFIPKGKVKPLDTIIFSARHTPELLTWELADLLEKEGQEVAVVNPVGHYADYQTRILGPDMLTRRIKKAVFLSSTQNADGGHLSVLLLTQRILRHPNFSFMVDEVDVVIPMFGGSRGHKPGQRKEIGYEVLQAIYDSKNLANNILDIEECIYDEHHKKIALYPHVLASRGEKAKFPKVRFLSVDIHNEELPCRKFTEAGFTFTSASPAQEQAEEFTKVLEKRKLLDLPLYTVCCDGGSRRRTSNFVRETLKLGKVEKVRILFMDKLRIRDGEVEGSKVGAVVECWLENGRVRSKRLHLRPEDKENECVIAYIDDMIDTGGTAESNISTVKSILKPKYSFFLATHAICSRGVEGALNRIGTNSFLIGNSLNPEGMDDPRIKIVNLAPAIARNL